MKPRSDRDDLSYLRDIIEYADNALRICAGASKEDLEANLEKFFATAYCLQTIGEAASGLSEVTRSAIPGVPWKAMRGMRNKLVHAYHGADSEIVFNVVDRDLPDLRSRIAAYLEEQGED